MLYNQNDKAAILKGKIVAIANQNGGVGKTTTAMNLGAALHELGENTLLVDFDPQGTLTIAHGLDPDSLSSTIYNAFVKSDFDIREAILRSENGAGRDVRDTVLFTDLFGLRSLTPAGRTHHYDLKHLRLRFVAWLCVFAHAVFIFICAGDTEQEA